MLKKAMLLGLLVLPLSLPAKAQNVCTARDEVLGHLDSKYSEAPVAMGLANNGGVIEVLSSGSGTTWTIIITMPNGVTCLMAESTCVQVSRIAFIKRRPMTLNAAADRYFIEVAEHQPSAGTTEYQLGNLIEGLGKDTMLSEITDNEIGQVGSSEEGERFGC